MPKDERPPYFNFYVDDFSSDGNVEAMTTEEVGAYILLLCKAWREEPTASLPNDDRTLARWARLTGAQWEANKAAVLRPFSLRADGRLYQKRLRKEYEKLQDSRRRKSEAASSAAKERWDRELHANALQTQCDRITDAMPADAISEPNNKDFPSESISSPKPPFDFGIVLPPCLESEEFRTAWAEWVQHKKEIRKKVTPTSAKKAIKALSKLGTQRAVAAIELSIEKGWVGIYEDQSNGKPQSRTSGGSQRTSPARSGDDPGQAEQLRKLMGES